MLLPDYAFWANFHIRLLAHCHYFCKTGKGIIKYMYLITLPTACDYSTMDTTAIVTEDYSKNGQLHA